MIIFLTPCSHQFWNRYAGPSREGVTGRAVARFSNPWGRIASFICSFFLDSPSAHLEGRLWLVTFFTMTVEAFDLYLDLNTVSNSICFTLWNWNLRLHFKLTVNFLAVSVLVSKFRGISFLVWMSETFTLCFDFHSKITETSDCWVWLSAAMSCEHSQNFISLVRAETSGLANKDNNQACCSAVLSNRNSSVLRLFLSRI